jgi:transcriptional antiterminator RfaH
MTHFPTESIRAMTTVATDPSWYCLRTKPKHEHIAAVNLHRSLGLQVFLPRLRLERSTCRGIVRVNEPLFPCYLFVHCNIHESLDGIQSTNGVRCLVRFSFRIPTIPEPVIRELQTYFEDEEPRETGNRLAPGTQVLVGEGAFAGMSGQILRVLPSNQRVQLLMEILGRLTPVEVNRTAITLESCDVVDLVPQLAASSWERLRV